MNPLNNYFQEHMDIKKLKSAYSSQKCASAKRGIAFNLTFDSWLAWWIGTEKLHLRGKHKGCYQMCRVNDVGAYEIGNIYCDSVENNSKLPHEGFSRPKEYTEKALQTKIARGQTLGFPEWVHDDAKDKAREKVFALIAWAIENKATLTCAVRKFNCSWNAMRTHKPEWEAEHGIIPLPKKPVGDKNWKHMNAWGVSCPTGEYASLKIASEVTGTPLSTAIYRCMNESKGWKYIKKAVMA